MPYPRDITLTPWESDIAYRGPTIPPKRAAPTTFTTIPLPRDLSDNPAHLPLDIVVPTIAPRADDNDDNDQDENNSASASAAENTDISSLSTNPTITTTPSFRFETALADIPPSATFPIYIDENSDGLPEFKVVGSTTTIKKQTPTLTGPQFGGPTGVRSANAAVKGRMGWGGWVVFGVVGCGIVGAVL
ncbi:hypothetical protein K402DRAFT_404644 [Aulographum hederae CBS 113979]|uniref:Uncharacterized protein n=1 Tax=Aulographum hederae CBS 113979 TaxID=1176131 RepID=A0A6G1GZM3_9PEZI|nr:hypothetical protein K402DRAFT_404644 [Aulographum hederae CBS 113979]